MARVAVCLNLNSPSRNPARHIIGSRLALSVPTSEIWNYGSLRLKHARVYYARYSGRKVRYLGSYQTPQLTNVSTLPDSATALPGDVSRTTPAPAPSRTDCCSGMTTTTLWRPLPCPLIRCLRAENIACPTYTCTRPSCGAGSTVTTPSPIPPPTSTVGSETNGCGVTVTAVRGCSSVCGGCFVGCPKCVGKE